MPVITEVRFRHEEGALAHTLESLPNLDVTVVPETGTDPENELYVFWFQNDEGDDIEATLEADPTVRDADPMQGLNNELWGIRFTQETKLLAPMVTAEDGFVLDARSAGPEHDPRGWHERWLLQDKATIQKIWRYAREEGFDFEVLDFRNRRTTDTEYSGRSMPTEQQQEALVMAYEQGYFREPRETSLEELGEQLGISPSAVGGRLKRGMKSLIRMTVMAETSEYPDTER